jgi:hypothetical protein
MKLRLIASLLAAPILCLIAFGQGAPSGFRASKADLRKQVIAVIDAQLEAFRSGDLEQAYGYAAAVLRFQTPPEAFAAIVRDNYPAIWANTRAEYGIVRDDGTHATVLVHVFSTYGGASYDYVLVKERRGWRIGSVTRREAGRKDDV